MCKRCRLADKIMAEFSISLIIAAAGRMMWERQFGHLPEGSKEREEASITPSGDELSDFIGNLDYEGLKVLRQIARGTHFERVARIQ
jgi:hypothetical protein